MRLILTWAAATALVLGAAGCGEQGVAQPGSAADEALSLKALAVKEECRRTDDPYLEKIVVAGPKVEQEMGDGSLSSIFIARKHEGDEITDYAVAVRAGRRPSKWHTARDRASVELRFVTEGVRWEGETAVENFVLLFPPGYLDSARHDGVDFKLFGTDGSDVFKLSRDYVRGFLAAVAAPESVPLEGEDPP